MKLILDTLERARLAASPFDAIALANAIADLGDLADVLAARGWTLDEAPATLDAFAAVVDHVAAQPFDVVHDGETLQIVEDTPTAFVDWLACLEGLAQ